MRNVLRKLDPWWWAIYFGIVLATFLIMGVWNHAKAHDFYTQWMKPDKPSESCCNKQDCEPAKARKLGDRKYQVFIEGEWVDIPPEKILDPLKPENKSPGGYHVCRRPGTTEIFCFREEEVKM